MEDARKPDLNTDKNQMVVSNNYITAVHPEKMTINAMKLFRVAITQCRMSDKGFYEYSFAIKELSEMLGVDRSDIYRDTQDLCKNIMQMLLYVGDGNPRHQWEYKHIFDKCRYDPKQEAVNIQLHKDMTALFLELKRNFTEIPIDVLLTIKSKYAIRIYEVICQKMMHHFPHASTSTEIMLTPEEIRKATRTDSKKTYDLIGNLKNKVILPSLAEIERCANWKIICTDVKRGRRIIGFNLQIWSANGYAFMEQCKKEGRIPGAAGLEDTGISGQVTIFDFDGIDPEE